MTALETKPTSHFTIVFTDNEILEVDSYDWKVDSSGLLMIRTKPHRNKYDMYFPFANMFQWRRDDA